MNKLCEYELGDKDILYVSKLCECGCGQELIKEGNRFIRGHSNRNEEIKKKQHNSIYKKFGKYHALQSEIVRNVFECTMMERYDAKHALQVPKFQEQAEQTCFKNFGVRHSMQSKKVQETYKRNYKEKYGAENPFQLKNIKEQIKQTNIEKIGVENPFQSEKIKDQIRQGNIEKYGGPAPMCSKEIQATYKNTCKEKFGVDNPFKLKKIQDQIKQTCLEKYGTEYPNRSKIVQDKIKQTNIEHWGVDHWAKTLQGRKLRRINSIKRRDTQLANGEPAMPVTGYIERICLNILQQYTKYNIIRNDQSFKYVVGRYPDGHISELKLFIQFDERQHFEDTEMTIYKEDDNNCTLELASLGYIVFRVSLKEWKENQEQIINQFKELVNENNR